MKGNTFFIFLLALSSAVSGYLLSKASWVGRVGMTFFYKEYNFMKVWWQGAIAVFIGLLILFALHSLFQKKLPTSLARILHFAMLVLAVTGLYFTYDDFTHDFSHKILGHSFHYGFYLVWADWILMCLFFMFKKKRVTTIVTTATEVSIVNP